MVRVMMNGGSPRSRRAGVEDEGWRWPVFCLLLRLASDGASRVMVRARWWWPALSSREMVIGVVVLGRQARKRTGERVMKRDGVISVVMVSLRVTKARDRLNGDGDEAQWRENREDDSLNRD
ncbi:hypothetical protein Dimus_032336, partial [Dionaea muscipula]